MKIYQSPPVPANHSFIHELSRQKQYFFCLYREKIWKYSNYKREQRLNKTEKASSLKARDRIYWKS